MKSPQNMFCIGTYPLTTFLVSKLQSFVVNAWICFVKVMGTHALQIQSFGFVKAKFPSLRLDYPPHSLNANIASVKQAHKKHLTREGCCRVSWGNFTPGSLGKVHINMKMGSLRCAVMGSSELLC